MKRITIAIIILMLMFGSGAVINNFKGSSAQFETTVNSQVYSNDTVEENSETLVTATDELVEENISVDNPVEETALNNSIQQEYKQPKQQPQHLQQEQIQQEQIQQVHIQQEQLVVVETEKELNSEQLVVKNKLPAPEEQIVDAQISVKQVPPKKIVVKPEIAQVELTANQQLANQRKALDLAPPIPPGTLGGGNGNGGPGAGQQTASSN